MKDIHPLPDCMAPDGADPCLGYHAARARIAELEAAMEKIDRLASTRDPAIRKIAIKALGGKNECIR